MGTEVDKEKPFVLIVEDDKELKEAGQFIFKTHGYRVDAASSYGAAISAMHKAEEGKIVVFIDLNLKGEQTGINLLEYIHKHLAHRVVPYVYTGNDSPSIRRLAKKAGAHEVYIKGVDTWDTLLDCVDYETSAVLRMLDLMTRDEMTGLDNFVEFKKRAVEILANAKARGKPEVISALLIDIDSFKTLNDTHGHELADEVLIQIGKLLREHKRPIDLLCRRAGRGDEFLILFSDMDKQRALEAGKKLQAAVNDTFVTKENWLKVRFSISIGVAEVRHDQIAEPEESLKKLLDEADTSEEGGLIERRRKERSERT